jgi:hypothetical protein
MKTTTAVGIPEDRTDCGPSAATGRSRLEPEISGSGTGHRGAAMMRIAQNEKPACQRAFVKLCQIREHLERAKGLEPSTPTLARSCSTTELHPRPKELAAVTPTTGRAMPKAARECNSRRAVWSATGGLNWPENHRFTGQTPVSAGFAGNRAGRLGSRAAIRAVWRICRKASRQFFPPAGRD